MRKVVEVLRLLFDQDRSQREIATILALSQLRKPIQVAL